MAYESHALGHPGAYLAEEMTRLGLSTADMAGALSVPVSFVQEILASRRAIEIGTASRLARITGREIDYWLRLQGRFEGRHGSQQGTEGQDRTE
jgi:addiction module HigA family antidote